VPHDSWVVGNESYVSLHFTGTDKYATGDNATESTTEDDAHCFVCGSANTQSLGASFHRGGDRASRTTFIARPEHAGWPGLLHGGVLFALLDDAVGWAARYHGQPCVTGRAQIRYRQPVPIHTALDIGAEIRGRGRALRGIGSASRRDTGQSVADFEA